MADFNTFWAAWQDIQNESLWVPSTTPQEMMYGAINGMVASLGDPYTEFFTPADSNQFQQDITGNFGGIGAELGENTQHADRRHRGDQQHAGVRGGAEAGGHHHFHQRQFDREYERGRRGEFDPRQPSAPK